MTPPPDARLTRLLGDAKLAPLRERLRRHFQRAAPDAPPATLRLGRLNEHEREALAQLTGRAPRQAQSMQIEVAAIDTALREAGIAGSLREALERLDGPIVHTAALRAEAEARWCAAAAATRHPGLVALLQSPTGLGLLKRLARQDADLARRLCERADAVLGHLPAAGLPLARIAAQTLGDAHALDRGQPTATVVLAAWRRHEAATPPDERDATADDESEERTRDVWARAGILVNELARPALFLNLPVEGAPDLSPPGEPGYLSLRRLLRTPPFWKVAGHDVFVCENPSIVAIAADRLGARCAPLVCTDGMPAAAQRELLSQLACAGARLRYHGDFDWPGIHIGNYVMRAHGARPWRFGAADYEGAAPGSPAEAGELAGATVPASWDAALAPAMRAHGKAIPEESVVMSLLEDL